MSIEAWPFLVSRNRVFDYRTVVAPQFMIAHKAAYILAKATSGDLTEENQAIYRKIHSFEVGDINLVFQIVQADNSYIGLEGIEVLKDEFGRPINLVEGLVVQGYVHDLFITKNDLLLAHKQMEKDYCSFWENTIRTPLVRPSKLLILKNDNKVDDILELHMLTSLNLSSEVPEDLEKNPNEINTTSNIIKSDKGTDIPLQPVVSHNLSEKQVVANGDLLCVEEFYENALEAFKQAIELNPNYAPAYRGLGDTFFYLGEKTQALQSYKQALQRDQYCALAYNGKGNIFFLNRQYQDALMLYEQAIQCDPNCAVAYFNKGGSLDQLGLASNAQEAYEQALVVLEKNIQQEPTQALLHIYKSKFLKTLNRHKEAKVAEARARELGYRRKRKFG